MKCFVLGTRLGSCGLCCGAEAHCRFPSVVVVMLGWNRDVPSHGVLSCMSGTSACRSGTRVLGVAQR